MTNRAEVRSVGRVSSAVKSYKMLLSRQRPGVSELKLPRMKLPEMKLLIVKPLKNSVTTTAAAGAGAGAGAAADIVIATAAAGKHIYFDILLCHHHCVLIVSELVPLVVNRVH
jgi:hypothetical protein